MLHYTHMDTEIGVLTIVEDEGYITRIIFGSAICCIVSRLGTKRTDTRNVCAVCYTE